MKRKNLSRRIEMARRSAFRMTPREEEVYLIVDGNSSRVCNLYAGDGTAYSVYITAEPSVLHTEPFFTIYNAAWPVYATHAVRLSLWEPKIVRCRENPVQAELELTDELLGMLIDTLHSEHTDVLCPSWVKTMWNKMVSINNREHVETPKWDMRFAHISPQMILEKPIWYRYAVPTRTPMPEYHRLLYPEMTFSEYWRRRHGDKTREEVNAELSAQKEKGQEIYESKRAKHLEQLEQYKAAFLSGTAAPPCEYAVLKYAHNYPINFHLPEVIGKHGIRGCRTLDYLDIGKEHCIDYYHLLIANDEHHSDFFENVARFAKTQKVAEIYTFPKSAHSQGNTPAIGKNGN